MRFFLLILLLTATTKMFAGEKFDLVTAVSKVAIVYAGEGPKLDSITANLLADDIELVTGYRPVVTNQLTDVSGNVILIGMLHSRLIKSLNENYFKQLEGKWECFSHKLISKPFKHIKKALVIAGSDTRGVAYGVFALSEKMGVSPWWWWADVHPEKKKQLSIHIKPFTSSAPSVKFRGIFINDEDWGLQPWAAKTFEPETGDIGPKTYAKVFELLLRLKANLIWPAMHPSTKAFFHYPGNVKTAEDYQIVIGSSHAEPMLRNNVDEWNAKTMGPFNYFTNKERIFKYWEDRIKESRGINAIYTLGMRGVHDGQMEGIKDLKEAVPVVGQIIQEEREMLSKYINKDITAIPQVLTPYKEVLDIYDNGLKVPEDVTLVWPDDNYGYIHRLNNKKEKARKGGAGVYYHASYWGRPHDYLWLPSTHPSLMREEMMKAYETGADRLWVLNVGDIKPQEYNIQQFLDMAYNATPFKNSRYAKQHLLRWTTALFGKEKAPAIQAILWEYYDLAFERKPEFMGWSQTEPTTQTTYTDYNHFYFGDEAQKRIDKYTDIETAAKALRSRMAPEKADAFYQLVFYPVLGASLLNKKFLYRDKAYFYSKQNRLSAFDFAQRSKAAYDSIERATVYYNTQLKGGKWNGMMSMKPRALPVYQEPVLPAISIGGTGAWGVAPEGFVTADSSLVGEAGSLSLAAFDNVHKQKYFIDIFLRKNETVNWTTAPSHHWIRLSKSNGHLGPEPGKNQDRIWVDIDWSKLAKNRKLAGSITFTGGNKQMVVKVQVSAAGQTALRGYKGFVENNGFVVMHAANYTRLWNKPTNQWRVLSDFGYTGNVLQSFPLAPDEKIATDTASIKQNSSAVEYEFYTVSGAKPLLTVFAVPTHPVNNNFSVRYAVSINDGQVKVIDIKTFGRSAEWKQNVLRNRAERKIELPFLPAGKHNLKIYVIDPGVILDEIRIDLGGLKKAYGAIPETRMRLAPE